MRTEVGDQSDPSLRRRDIVDVKRQMGLTKTQRHARSMLYQGCVMKMMVIVQEEEKRRRMEKMGRGGGRVGDHPESVKVACFL